MTYDFLDLDAVGQSELVRRKEISLAELIEATIDRIEARNAELNFLATKSFDVAREVAARRERDGRLAGAPMLLKDLVAYPEIPCAFGCRLLASAPPEPETPYAAAIAGAGLIPLGRTTTSELGLLGSTESLLWGKTRNPWDRDRSAGGSSGGAAAAVACRAVPLAHASDGGGSIRIPASMNGVFGLKPSAGRTAPSAHMSSPLTPLVSDHCVTVSVRDSAAYLAATEQAGAGAPLPPCGYVTGPLTEKLKIGYYDKNLVGSEVEPAVRAALERTVGLCRDLGHEVVKIDPPRISAEAVSDGFFTLAGSMVDGLEQMVRVPLDDSMVEPFTLALLEWYRARPENAIETALADLEAVKTATIALVQRHDVILTPTLAIEPPPLGYLAPDLPRETLFERMGVMAGFSVIHNIAGLPAMNVPLYFGPKGLPIGSQFAADYGHERLLLRLAYQLEEACPWANRGAPVE